MAMNVPAVPASASAPVPVSAPRAALPSWAAELARLWNSAAHSLFIVHGNIHDLFPVAPSPAASAFAALGPYFRRRLFPNRAQILYYDLAAGLTFASAAMQTTFFEWLKIYDEVEHTDFHRAGPPRAFTQLLPVLRRFFLRMAEETGPARGVTLVINYPEKLVPAADDVQTGPDERIALVTLLTWAASPELHRGDVGVVLVTETISELHPDLLQNPHVARVRIDLPTLDERAAFLASGWLDRDADGRTLATHSDLSTDDLARRTSGLPLLRIEQLLATALRNDRRITAAYVSQGKRRLIEEYCGDLVTFKDPKAGRSLDLVATHVAAKVRLRELAQLIRDGQHAVVERGVLVPGRVGVGKSFLIDCFASECGLPVLELGQFRSKWVGETERQQARILLTIRALGPVIVVVDEADAVFGNRSADGDSGVSSRVFAAFAAHLGDSSLRGRELWIAMTSRPDLMAIDLKRQGRFGLCVPLFPAQSPDEVVQLFTVVAKVQGLVLGEPLLAYVREVLGPRPLTGSDVESVLVRARERAVLAGRGDALELVDMQTAVDAFIDPLDENLLALQELAAVLAVPWLGAAKPARAAIAPSDWQIFLHRHLRDQGRITDDASGQISHSEGQGFSLLCAEAVDDLGSFLAILDWTNRVLQRPNDALFAWRFHPTRGVDDPNNATDGDLLIAWALLRGAERWRRADFAEQGRAIARDILRLLVRDVQGQIILLPGHRGFEQPHDIIINPSYYVFPALRALARAVPDPAWLRVVGDGLWLMRRSLFGRWGLPADWVALPRNGERPRPAPGWPARFSYDAVRVPLYLGWAGLTAEPPLQAAARFWAGDLARAPAWVDLATDAPAPYGASHGVRAIASFSVATGSEAARVTQMAFPPIRESQAYYSAILGLLTRLALRDFLQNRA